jgi:hypothetical protein
MGELSGFARGLACVSSCDCGSRGGHLGDLEHEGVVLLLRKARKMEAIVLLYAVLVTFRRNNMRSMAISTSQ